MMKKLWRKLGLLTLVLALVLGVCVAAEAETLTAYGAEFDSEAAVIDLDEKGIVVKNITELKTLIEQMPNLTEVHMYDSKLTREQMDELFDGYPNIFFGWTLKLYTHTIRTDTTAFSTLHGHQGKKDDPFHTTKQLSMLRYCKNLEALDIGHNYLTNLDFLTELPHLKILIIAANYQCTGDLTPLASLTELEYLEIFSTNTTDVSPLAALTNLRDLNVTYNRKLKDISPLYDLPNLERFWCGYTAVPQEQRAAMEAAHPNCEFDWVNQPTEGTWRKHPHYDTIYKVFQESVYYPFDD